MPNEIACSISNISPNTINRGRHTRKNPYSVTSMGKMFPGLVFLLHLLISKNKVMQVEAALCEAPSKLFHGICITDGNCARICEKEGYLSGHCKGLRMRCICFKDCGGGGPEKPPESPPDSPPEGPPEGAPYSPPNPPSTRPPPPITPSPSPPCGCPQPPLTPCPTPPHGCPTPAGGCQTPPLLIPIPKPPTASPSGCLQPPVIPIPNPPAGCPRPPWCCPSGCPRPPVIPVPNPPSGCPKPPAKSSFSAPNRFGLTFPPLI